MMKQFVYKVIILSNIISLIFKMKKTSIIKWWISLVTYVSCQTTWRDAYNRGNTTLISYCADPTYIKLPDGLCYPPCIATYTDIYSTPTCYGPCFPRFVDSGGTTCSYTTGGGSYWRPAGTFTMSQCLGQGNPNGCEVLLSMYYEICDQGFYSTAASVCQCFATSTTQIKATYARVGVLPICDPLQRDPTDGLCYPWCIQGYTPDRNICWKTACPTNTAPCGTSLCLASTITCAGSAQLTQATNVYNQAYTVSTGGTTNFIMEDIVRSIAGTTASMDGGLTFNQIDAIQAGPRFCRQKRFPLFLGSSGGNTFINIIQLDQIGNIGFAGQSSDPNIVTIANNKIIGLFESTGYNITWAVEFTAALGQQVTQLAFKADNTQLVALFGTTNITLLVLNTLDGTLVSQISDITGYLAIKQHSITLDPLSNWIYLSATSVTNNMVLIGLNLMINPLATSFPTFTLNTQTFQAFGSAYISRTSSLYVAVQDINAQSTNLLQVQIFYPSGVFTPVLSQTNTLPTLVSNYINHQMRGWSDGSTTDVIVYAGEPATVNQNGLFIFRRQLAPSITDEGFIYQENTFDSLKIVDIQLYQGTQAYLVYKNVVRGKIGFLSILYIGGGKVQVQNKVLTKPILTISQFNIASVTSSGDFYFAGQMQSLPSTNPSILCMNASPGNVGLISITDNNQGCLASQLSSGSQYQINLDPTLVFTPIIASGISSTATLGSLNIISSIIPQTKLYITRNTCCDVTVTTQSVGYVKYVVDYPTETYTFPSFTQILCQDSFPFWYKRDYTIQPFGSPFDVPYIYFDNDPLNLKFVIQTSDAKMAGNYYIKVTGTLPNQQFAFDMFSYIEVWNIPATEFITATMIADQTYIATDVPLFVQVDDFIPSNLFYTYYIIYYLEMWDETNLSWTRNVTSDLFSFNQGGLNPNITIYTSDNLKKGMYKMRLMGRFTPNTVFEAVSPFILTILDQCYKCKIQVPKDIPQALSFTMTFPTALPTIWTFTDWTFSMPLCGPLDYKVTLSSGQPLPRFLSFSAITRQLVVNQNQYTKAGSYQIRIQGKLRNFFVMEVILIQLDVICEVKQMRPSQAALSFSVMTGGPPVTYQVPNFQQLPQCGKPVVYQTVGMDDQALDVRYAQYTEVTDSVLGTITRKLIMKAPLDGEKSQYIILLNAYVDGTQANTPLGTQTITVKIKSASQSRGMIESKYPPLFQTQQAGTSWEVPFVVSSTNPGGRILQSSQYQIKLTKKQIQYLSGEISANSITLVDTTQPASFFDESTGMLSLTASTDADQGTRYAVWAEVEDAKKTFKITQELYMIVYRGSNNINMEEEKFLIQGLLERTKQEFGGNGQGMGGIEGDNIASLFGSSSNFRLSSAKDKDFSGRIVKINDRGVVTIQFTKELVQIKNLTAIDNQTLDIRVLVDTSQNTRNLSIRFWNVTSMSRNQIDVKLYFSKPLDISAYDLEDLLRVEVLSDYLFLTQNRIPGLYSFIKNKTIWTKRIPRQLNEGDQNIVGATGMFSKGVFSSVLSSALVAALMGSSMIGVWGMINVSQLLMIIPLMNVKIPANAQVVFTQLQNIISFNLISTEMIPKYNEIFHFKNTSKQYDSSQESLISPRFDLYGYQSKSLIENLGSSILWLALSFLFQLTLFTIHRTLSLVRLNFKYLDRLERETFFNMFIRMLQEGALEFMIGGTINVLYYDFTTNGTECASTIFAITVLGILGLLIIGSFIINARLCGNQEAIQGHYRVSAIFEGVKTDNFHRMNYPTYGLIRRALLVGMLIFLKDYTLLQIVLLNLHQIAFTGYLLYYRPLDDPQQMKMEIFNECMLMLASQTLFGFTDFQSQGFDPEAKYNFGWYLTGIMLFTVGTNTLVSIITTLKQVFKTLRRRLRCCRKKQSEKNIHDTVQIKPTSETESENLYEIQPPPVILSERSRVLASLQFKSSQDVIRQWIQDVKKLDKFPKNIKSARGNGIIPTSIQTEEKGIFRQQARSPQGDNRIEFPEEDYNTGVFLGIKKFDSETGN